MTNAFIHDSILLLWCGSDVVAGGLLQLLLLQELVPGKLSCV